MGSWPAASGVYFLYAAVAAVLAGGIGARARVRALALALLGLLLAAAGSRLPAGALRTWIVPPALLLIAYWTSGCFFSRAMPRLESMLQRWDRRLRVRPIAGRTPAPIAELLEFAYAAVYAVIPIALLLHLRFSPAPDPDRFWLVVLVTDYICFGMLPWAQTRPPRALEEAPWHARFRRFNERLLGRASIHANTFPSGHAAEALIAALLVLGLPWPVAAGMFVSAALISAGAVLGRYHYAVDAIAGWVVAIAVFLCTADI